MSIHSAQAWLLALPDALGQCLGPDSGVLSWEWIGGSTPKWQWLWGNLTSAITKTGKDSKLGNAIWGREHRQLTEQSCSCTREGVGPNPGPYMSQLFLTLSSFCTHQILKLPLSYLCHSKSSSYSGFLLTMHNISEDGIQTIFLTTAQVIWDGGGWDILKCGKWLSHLEWWKENYALELIHHWIACARKSAQQRSKKQNWSLA